MLRSSGSSRNRVIKIPRGRSKIPPPPPGNLQIRIYSSASPSSSLDQPDKADSPPPKRMSRASVGEVPVPLNARGIKSTIRNASGKELVSATPKVLESLPEANAILGQTSIKGGNRDESPMPGDKRKVNAFIRELCQGCGENIPDKDSYGQCCGLKRQKVEPVV